MEEEIDINVVWRKDLEIPVRVSPLICPRELAEISSPMNSYLFSPKYLYNGSLLDPSISLKAQNVVDGSVIVIYERGFSISSQAMDSITDIPFIQTTSFEEKIFSVMLEVHRIQDSYFSAVERHRKANILFTQINESDMMSEIDEHGVLQNEQTETVIVEKPPDEVPVDPLPYNKQMKNEDLDEAEEEEVCEEDGSVFPFFENFEEAGKFFTKHPWSEWAW